MLIFYLSFFEFIWKKIQPIPNHNDLKKKKRREIHRSYNTQHFPGPRNKASNFIELKAQGGDWKFPFLKFLKWYSWETNLITSSVSTKIIDLSLFVQRNYKCFKSISRKVFLETEETVQVKKFLSWISVFSPKCYLFNKM